MKFSLVVNKRENEQWTAVLFGCVLDRIDRRFSAGTAMLEIGTLCRLVIILLGKSNLNFVRENLARSRLERKDTL